MPINVSRAPASASPLWIIALFIALSEATAGAAAVATNGITRLIFTCFAVAFPTLVFSVFTWLLIKHAPNLYAPGQYSKDITPEAYRTGISRAESLLLGKAVAETMVPLLGHQDSLADEKESIVDQAARRFEAVIVRSSLIVRLDPSLKPRVEELQIPVTNETAVSWLLDTIYWSIQPSVQPFSYAETWILFRDSDGYKFSQIGTKWARKSNMEEDLRPIAEVGIMPGTHLTAARPSHMTEVRPRTITLRNVITGDRLSVKISPGQTVKQVVESNGFLISGTAEFSVRDKSGVVVDDEYASSFEGMVLNVGLKGYIAGG